MGSKATICAQVAQLENEKTAANKNAAKKADILQAKVEKADLPFQLFKSEEDIRMEILFAFAPSL